MKNKSPLNLSNDIMGWKKISDELPPPDTKVEICFEWTSPNTGITMRHITIAVHEDGTIAESDSYYLSNEDDTLATVYDEERDIYLLSDAWYEIMEGIGSEYCNMLMPSTEQVTHWRYLTFPNEDEEMGKIHLNEATDDICELRLNTPAGALIAGIKTEAVKNSAYIKFQPVAENEGDKIDSALVTEVQQEWDSKSIASMMYNLDDCKHQLLHAEYFSRDAMLDSFKIHQKCLCLLTGPSGAGKTTLANYLTEQYGFKAASSYTDRPPRFDGEIGHIFVSKEEFDKLDNLLAPTSFAGYRYGLPASTLEDNDIVVLEPDGVKDILEHYKGSKKIVVVGVQLAESVRMERMLKRGDSEAVVRDRLEKDKVRFMDVNKLCDVVFHNDNYEKLKSFAATLASILK